MLEDIRAFRGNGVIATTTYLIATYIQLGLCSFMLLAHSKGLNGNRCLVTGKCVDIERWKKPTQHGLHCMHVPYVTGSWHFDAITNLSHTLTTLSLHYTPPTTTHHNQKPWRKTTGQRQVAFVYLRHPHLSLHLLELQQARVMYDEDWSTAGLQWPDRMGTMDGMNKERTRRTCGGERIMWTALFFPPGFDEVAHDSG